MSSQPKPEAHQLAFVDVETTGLDVDRHEIWEIALIIDSVSEEGEIVRKHTRRFYPFVNLGQADPRALTVGRYYESGRRPTKGTTSGGHYNYAEAFKRPPDPFEKWGDNVLIGTPSFTAHYLEPLLVDVHLVGCTIHFDAAFLTALLRKNNACPMWNYHLIDATVYAAGKLGLTPPWKSSVVAEAYGMKLKDEEAHDAMVDARLARRLYYAAQGIDIDGIDAANA